MVSCLSIIIRATPHFQTHRRRLCITSHYIPSCSNSNCISMYIYIDILVQSVFQTHLWISLIICRHDTLHTPAYVTHTLNPCFGISYVLRKYSLTYRINRNNSFQSNYLVVRRNRLGGIHISFEQWGAKASPSR